MNVDIDPAAEETKGGAGHVAKALFSYGPDRVGVVCYVPKELQDRVTADVWAAKIVESMGGEMKGKATAKLAKGFVLGDKAKELYPIKMKDELLKASIAFLQEIGVFPDKDDDDSDDEMVFGDDDFPCDAEEEAEEAEEEEEEEADGPEVDPKALKAIVKEGGKKGAEVAGAADMGGMTHMNVSLDLPEGRVDMMLKALEAMNVDIDPAAEETKGGAGHVAKALFSYGPDRVGVVCYVPKELQDRVTRTALGLLRSRVNVDVHRLQRLQHHVHAALRKIQRHVHVRHAAHVSRASHLRALLAALLHDGLQRLRVDLRQVLLQGDSRDVR